MSIAPPSPLPPIRREILVDTDPATAFAVFTDRIGQWWPLEDLSVYGAGGTVGFTDGRLVERSEAGEVTAWGRTAATGGLKSGSIMAFGATCPRGGREYSQMSKGELCRP